MDLRIFVEPQQGATYDDQLAIARVAEDLGYDGFFRSDHYLAVGAVDGRPGPTDSWLTLAGLARETRSLRLGTLMSAATFRLPGPLAIQVAQVDEMSGGRVELGLGTGWYEDEHRAYGIPFPARRFDLLEEQLDVVTGIWGTPESERFEHAGPHYRLTDCPALPRPRQRPRPPIIVGGRGPRRTPAIAARYADEYNIGFVRPDQAERQYKLVREACEAEGRDPAGLTCSVALVTCCGTSDAEVAERARRIDRGVAELRATGLGGSPEEVVDKIGRYAEAGARRIYLQILDMRDWDHLELIAHQVKSRLT
ncbi:LLM class F420-dependent oxidoreductase [Streptomyces sp. NPDC046909]|uniref:LLM class F420-dependent oxidoreductase n=1 Tax=Streptomyces sp. NPDC046909 TaxID=3155617 RepID=UPI0033FBC7AE